MGGPHLASACPFPDLERAEDTERNAGIASMITPGQSWNSIQAATGCSSATIAKHGRPHREPPGPPPQKPRPFLRGLVLAAVDML